MELDAKLTRLEQGLKDLGKASVAFSGGVDSTLLLYIASKQLGKNCLAITAHSRLWPEREYAEAVRYCATSGIEQLTIERNELSLTGFAANPVERCYICKRDLMSQIKALAARRGITHVVEGSNKDDDMDYRPGMKALGELGILSPLKDAGLSKSDIRQLSARFELPTHDKPSFACLATRIPHGQRITEAALERIDQAEQLLLDTGFKQVRVRSHGDIARIEIDRDDFELISDAALRQSIHEALSGFGYRYVTLDLLGYRTGSMNPAQ